MRADLNEGNMPRRGRGAAWTLGLVGLLVAGSPASIWVNPGTGAWENPANWEGGVPTSGDAAYLANGGTAVVGAAGGTCY